MLILSKLWITAGLIILITLTILFLVRVFRITYREDLLLHWKKAFITVNLFYLVIILVLIADKIVAIS